jgi:hypothetical protein
MNWQPHPILPLWLRFNEYGVITARAGRSMSPDVPFVAYGIGDRAWSAFGDTLTGAQANFDANYARRGTSVAVKKFNRQTGRAE